MKEVITMKKTNANIRINRENETLEVSKTFYKRASVFGTPECQALAKAQKMCPTFSVAIKSSAKKSYSGLNYRLMEAYIAIQKNADVLKADYEAVRRNAEEEYESIYPIVKKWFLGEFASDGKTFDVRKAKAEIAQAFINDAVLSAMYSDVVDSKAA